MKSNIDQAYNRIIGNQIHVAMSKKNMSLEDLSRVCAIPKPTLARYIRGENTIPNSRLQAISKAVDIDFLSIKQEANELLINAYHSIAESDQVLIKCYRNADSSRQKAVRAILGMDE